MFLNSPNQSATGPCGYVDEAMSLGTNVKSCSTLCRAMHVNKVAARDPCDEFDPWAWWEERGQVKLESVSSTTLVPLEKVS